jgi:hypothetical protein
MSGIARTFPTMPGSEATLQTCPALPSSKMSLMSVELA